MRRHNYLIVIVSICVAGCIGCQPQNKNLSADEPDGVVIDEEMAEILFPPGKDILTGGDGAISIAVDKNSSIFLWGDSFFGEVKDNQRDTSTPLVLGNVWQLLNGKQLTYHYRGTPAHPEPLLSIGEVDGHRAVLWPMHGFVKDNILHVFMSVIVTTGSGTWDFYWDGSLYYRLDYPSLHVIDYELLEGGKANGVHYGFGVYEKEGHYYVYGTRPDEGAFTAPAHVSRAVMKENRLQEWEYYDGTGWNRDAMATQEMKGIDVPVAEQFNVFPYQDQFILLFHERPIDGNKIYSYTSKHPAGPWGNKTLLYEVPETATASTVFSYNAMTHPQFDREGKLLVSYCINTHQMEDLYTDASIYKPRFIRVPYSLIIGDEKR